MRHLSKIIIILIFHTSFCSGQVFELYDQDLYAKNPKTKPIQNGDYADINATLRVNFNKDSIAESIRAFTGSDTINLDEIKKLRIVLQNQVEILQGFKSYAADPTLESLNNLADQMNTFFMVSEKYQEIQDLYNEYSAQYNTDYTRKEIRNSGTNGIPFRDEYIFVQMAKKASELANSIQEGIGKENISFLLSGQITTNTGTRNINLSDEFDSFSADSYTVSRWQTQLTKEGQRQLEQIGQLSKTLNKLMNAKIGDVKKWLKDSFKADDCIKDIEASLKSIPETVSTLAPQLANQIKEVALAPYEQAKDLAKEYDDKLNVVPDISSVTLLQGFSSSLTSTADSIDNLISTMDQKLISLLKNEVNNPKIAAFITTYDTCKVELENDKNKILNIAHRISSLFSHSKKAADASEDLGEKVKRLSFADIPDHSLIDLTNSGQRANGDQIKINATLEMPSVDGADAKRRVIERSKFKVQQIGLYSRVRPLLLLANPRGDNPNIDLAGKKFQFAPSYSILFKFGSRTSRAINEIWQPSIGVNFGALDFDTDATPEFSTALEFTFLKDYFSVGYGYNFGADAKYFMLGFRIPVGALPLPMFNDIQNTENLD